MKLRNTVLMAIVLVVLAGFVYFYEIRGREGREAAERVEKLLLDFEADAVESLTLEAGENLVEITRTEDGWHILQPYELAADDTAVDSLLDQLAAAEQERLVVEAAEDLAPFGLDAPPVRVTLQLDDGTALSLQVGGGTPVGFNVYVSPGTERDVYMTPAALKDNLDKSLFDLRNKQILEFDDVEVEGVDIDADTFEVRLRRSVESSGVDAGAAKWQFTVPSGGRANNDAVSTSLRRLRTDRAAAFVSESPSEEEIEAFGLADPRYSVTVWTTGDASQMLQIGAESGEPSGVFARRRGSESIFVIPETLVAAIIPESIDDLRDRSLVDVERDRITALELNPGDQSYRVERRGSEWRIADPRDLDADASQVSGLLTSLLNLNAEGFAEGTADNPEYGLNEPSLTVRAHLTPKVAPQVAGEETAEADEPTAAEETPPAPRAQPEGQRREVLLLRAGAVTEIEVDPADAGAPGGEEPETPDVPEKLAVRYVALAGEPTVYLVRDSELDAFRTSLFDLRAKTLVNFVQEDLSRLEVLSEGALYDIEKRGESWIRTGQQEGEIEATRISDVLWNLNYLRMEGVAAEWDATASPPDLSTFGLAPPMYRIKAYAGEQVVADVQLGVPVPAGELEGLPETAPAEQVYALAGESPAVFRIGRRLGDAVESLASELAGGG